MSFRLVRRVRFALFLCVFAIITGALPTLAQDMPLPEAVGERPDAPIYALHGPFWVGTQTIEIGAGTDDAYRFVVWYPALNPEGATESAVYTMSENHIMRAMLPADAPFTVLGHALENAVPDLSQAPYPLVIYSHAFTAQLWQVYLGEHLASYGFVTVAPEHANDSWDNVYVDLVTRTVEIRRAIADAAILTSAEGALAGMIDVDRIAVGGHSAGGMSAYAAGGAPIDWTGAEQYCAAVPDDPTCTELASQHEAVVDLLGPELGEDKLLPVEWDTRVDAIFPMSGTMELHGEKGLPAITVPMMTLFGSADPAEPWMRPAYDLVGSEQKAAVVFENGGHGLFYNQCEAFPYLLDYELYWGCSDSVWDLARSQDLTNHFVTAFLLDVLKDDADAHAALAPDVVDFPGIVYEAQGF